MYDTTLPYLRHQLEAFSAVLKKAEAHCEAKKIEPQALLTARLFPDMLPFTRQVQIACDFAKGCAARLGGHAVPSYKDDEASFAELQARITKTIDFMDSVKKDDLKDSAKREITIKIGGKDRTMSGEVYYNALVVPNFYFHVTTAYDLLRHNGVELGKNDFIGRP